MNLLIPTRNKKDDTLKFAIRSICEHNTIDRCLIVGFKPDWYLGEHLNFTDYIVQKKEENIRDKVYAGSKILSEFLFANDDHFVLAPYPGVHNKGLLSETIKGRSSNGSYTICLQNTLKKYGDVENVDTHCPMVMNREGVERTMFEWPVYGYGFKTTYSQENGIESTYYPDNKVKTLNDVSGPYFSTYHGCADLSKLNELFPNKSKFEV